MHPNVIGVITVIVNIIVITSIINVGTTIITNDCVSWVKSWRSLSPSLNMILIRVYESQDDLGLFLRI
jgi:hypothetical protein